MENIDLDQKLEYKGYWYLPTAPEDRVAGVLTYYPNEKIMLELMGCFGEYSRERRDGFLSLRSRSRELDDRGRCMAGEGIKTDQKANTDNIDENNIMHKKKIKVHNLA